MEDREVQNRLSFFRELVSCAHNIYFTEYDAVTFTPVFCNAPHDSAIYFFLPFDFSTAFDAVGKPLEQATGKTASAFGTPIRPAVGINSLGMVWIATVELREGKPYHIHVMGPVFLKDYSLRTIEGKLSSHTLSPVLRQEFIAFIERLPVVAPLRLYEYALMLHYTLTGEKITVSDLHYLDAQEKTIPEEETAPRFHSAYLAEQQLLRMVKEGNLQYRSELDRLRFTRSVPTLTRDDLLRSYKDRVIILTSLCCQAAMEGGLSPEVAYTLSDRYVRDVEAAQELPLLDELSHTMVADFIQQVYRIKTGDAVSPQLRGVCDAIALNPQQDWTLAAVAEKLGYTESYLSKKFKQELGMGVKEYVLAQRVKLAKEYLLAGNLPISDISDRLGFATHSSFGVQFRRMTGMTPSEFRANGSLSP